MSARKTRSASKKVLTQFSSSEEELSTGSDLEIVDVTSPASNKVLVAVMKDDPPPAIGTLKSLNKELKEEMRELKRQKRALEVEKTSQQRQIATLERRVNHVKLKKEQAELKLVEARNTLQTKKHQYDMDLQTQKLQCEHRISAWKEKYNTQVAKVSSLSSKGKTLERELTHLNKQVQSHHKTEQKREAFCVAQEQRELAHMWK